MAFVKLAVLIYTRMRCAFLKNFNLLFQTTLLKYRDVIDTLKLDSRLLRYTHPFHLQCVKSPCPSLVTEISCALEWTIDLIRAVEHNGWWWWGVISTILSKLLWSGGSAPYSIRCRPRRMVSFGPLISRFQVRGQFVHCRYLWKCWS